MTRPRFKTRWLTHYLLPAFVLVSSVVVFYVMGSRPDVPRKAKAAPQATVVEVAVAETLNGPLVIETTGEVVPHRVLSLASEVAGRVVWKHPQLRVGEQVQAGEILIKVDPQRFALEVQQLEIELDQATTQLKQVGQNQTNLAEQLLLARKSEELQMAEVSRARKLVESNAFSASELSGLEKVGVESRLVVERLEGQRRSLQIELAQQELATRLAAVKLEQAKLDQAAAEVRAPVSGIVVAAPLEEHAMLQVGDQLAVIEEAGRLEVHCHLKLDEMAWVWEGSQQSPDITTATEPSAPRLAPLHAEVIYNAGGRSHTLAGQLVRHHGAGLDSTTRTVACRILVEQPASTSSMQRQPIPLMTGMFVTVQVQCQPNRPLLTIPERGIRTDGSVWLMRDGKLCTVPAKTVQLRNGTAVVQCESNDIQPGDKVIISPVANARDGLAVRERIDANSETHRAVADRGQPKIATHAANVGDPSP
ncbi:MAG: HlyD family efflux transporter periplasmic adaptor subunit [Planctomycetaceae bacterium]|nr:HlyD family efflux transporter periplasmic adaptor subunit [Planctomycetales bacterium]MCB9924979.1 HlyD family efflux transporter periplasmic adaptor subunit [Planctomycetaceae bacterium]